MASALEALERLAKEESEGIDTTGVNQATEKIESAAKNPTPTSKPAAKPISGVPTSGVGKAGFLLGQFGAAATGRETPLQRLQKANTQAEELSIRQANVGLQAVTAGTKQLDAIFKNGTPSDEQLAQFYGKFAEFDKIAPGTVESLQFLAEQRKRGNAEEVKQFESVLESNGVNIATLGMSLEQVKKTWDASPEFKKAMIEKADARHLRTGIQKVGDIKTQMAQGVIPEQEINLATAIDTLNPLLTGENADKRLTENEVQSLLRNPAQLSKLGITPDEIVLAEAKEDNLIKTDLGDRIIFTEKGKPDVIVKEFKKGLTPSSDTLGKPPTVDQLLKLEGPNGETPPLGVPLAELKEQGFKVKPKLSKKDEDKLKAVNATLDQLDKLALGEDGVEGAGGVFRAKPGADNRIIDDLFKAYGRFTQSDKELVLFESFSQGTVASLVRAAGEKGNLSNRDIERGINLIPNAGDGFFSLPDTRDVAAGKIRQLREWFDDIAGTSDDSELTEEEIADLKKLREEQNGPN